MYNVFKKLLCASVLAICFTANANAAPAKVGDMAPHFNLEDQSGNVVDLNDLKGKTVVLEWTNPDCPYVRRHYKEDTMEKLQAENKDTVWLAVNSSHFATKEANAKWASKESLNYPVLNDSTGTIGKRYGAKTTPHMFIIGSDGAIKYSGAIDDDPHGDNEPNVRKNYVNAGLTELAGGKEQLSTSSTKPYGCSVKYQ